MVENVTPEKTVSEQALSKDAKTFGMLCHLIAFAGFIIPLGNIIGPLVIWLLKKDEFEFVDDQGKESLNFQISVIIYAIISAILIIVILGIFLLIALGIFAIVMMIIGAVRANEGIRYRYPLSIRFIK
ncbi:MAG: orotate phosphoribosyltransferase [Caldithrix sp. RBG_13_44_9]|nr:MAG: orotate phosphoribosyltransferase [Caldithrix sp. RBG_13_44_9]